jgi:hypothetical protein
MALFKIDEKELEKNKQILGCELGIYYTYIYNDVYSLIYEWQEYKELFNKSKKRFEIMNKSTGSFFWLIQNILLQNIILAICRLTDEIRPRKIDKTHLSIYILPKAINDNEFKVEINKICSQIRKSVCEIRDQRDSYIAHTDLDRIQGGSAIQIEFDSIENITDLFYKIIRIFNQKYFNSDIVKNIISPINGARSLIQIMADGLEYREQRQNRILSGNYLEDDLQYISID